MKKIALAATTALVAAGSAAALEVTLGGQVTTTVAYNGTSFANADIGADADDNLTLTVSGESMGWTYGASIDMLADTLAGTTISLGNADFGSMEFTESSFAWSGMSVGGFALSASIADLAALETAVIGIDGSIGGMSLEADVTNNADRDFTAKLGTSVGATSATLGLTGKLGSTAATDLAYTLDLGMSAMGADLTVKLDEAGLMSVEAAMGNLTLTTSLADGDSFNDLSLGYSADLAEGLALSATLAAVDTDSSGSTDSTSLSVSTTLSF